MNVRESVFDVLRFHGVTTVFGNPGFTELAFLEHFPDDFTFVLGLHEASVVSIADGWAQAARKPALVVLHSAAGLGNAVGSIKTAFHNRTPLIIVTGQMHRAMQPGEPMFFERNAREIPAPFVRWSHEPARAADVPATFARAIHMATQAPAGPVHLAVPYDDWAQDAAPVLGRRVARRTAPDPGRLSEAARALDESARPALVLGAEVDRAGAWDAAVALAVQVGAAVYVPPNAARLSFPGDHPLFRGSVYMAQKAAAQQLAGHDVIVAVGAGLFDYMAYMPGPALPEGTRLLQFTEDAEEAAHGLAGDAAVGDAGLTIEILTRLTRQSDREPQVVLPPPAVEPSEAISADAALEVLEARRPAGSVVLLEASSHASALFRRVRVTRSGGFYYAGKGGLGFALPAAVGVTIAEPGRRAICVIGDGASLYCIQSLWTAVQHKAPVTVLVLNNAGYNSLKASADLMDLTHTIPGLDVPGIDFVKLAEGFGCPAERVERLDDLGPALDRAFSEAGPVLIDLAVDPTVRSLLS